MDKLSGLFQMYRQTHSSLVLELLLEEVGVRAEDNDFLTALQKLMSSTVE